MTLRVREEALAIGDMQELPADRRRSVFAALRSSEDGFERAVTVFNFDAKPCRVQVELGRGIGSLRNYLSGEVVCVSGESLTLDLDRYGFKLFRVIDQAPCWYRSSPRRRSTPPEYRQGAVEEPRRAPSGRQTAE